MEVPIHFVYLIALTPFLIIWLLFFLVRKDTQKEMLMMSIIIGTVSVVSSYFWWTIDWWQPTTITHTKVGIEDFIMGFTSGGIMVIAYEIIFKKKYKKIKRDSNFLSLITILLFLSNTTAFLIWGFQLTTFWASLVSMITVAVIIFYLRRDLILNGIFSGFLMMFFSLTFYYSILLLSPGWISSTYMFKTLSGILVTGVPVEELVFWFLAGLVWGPLYEYGFNLKQK